MLADPTFEAARGHLRRVAYRMLGTVSDAEDVVQEAYLRWRDVDASTIAEPRAFLTRITTRLCLDQLKSARVRRESYVGTWLPEPVASAASAGADVRDDLSVALLMTLERLSPLERAAFLLHDVFDVDYAELAETLSRSEPACRQLVARARQHVQAHKPRFEATPDATRRVTAAFQAAMLSGDTEALGALLANDAVLYADGGGKRLAARHPVAGREKILKLMQGIVTKYGWPGSNRFEATELNGQPAWLVFEPDGLETILLAVDGERIAALYLVRNPDKLRHLERQPAPGSPELGRADDGRGSPRGIVAMFEHHTSTLTRVAEHFSRDAEVVGLLLGGSIAHGFCTAESDVDVMIVVSDADHAERLRSVRTGFFSRELCTYEAGYVDGKYISASLLREVAARGSEPARFAFQHARVIFSRDGELSALVEAAARYPVAGKAERIRRFQAQVEAWRWYSAEALKKQNLPLLRLAVAKLTLFAGRIVLAHNELLYPYHKWFLRVLAGAPEKPAGLIEQIEALAVAPDAEQVERFAALIRGFRGWEIDPIGWGAQFMLDSELNWLHSTPPIDDL